MVDEDQLALLRGGIEVWNEWRENNPEAEIDLSGAHFFGANLIGADLSGAYLSNVNLSGADLISADLISADLTDANLRNADLEYANLTNADLRYANLTDANLTDANLRNAYLTNADLEYANLTNADLRYANLTNANLSKANLRNADLNDTRISNRTRLDRKWQIVWNILNNANFDRNLRNADLSDADLSYADLRYANLSDADLSHANLSKANLRDSVISDKTKLDRKWQTVWNILNNADFDRNLRATDLRDADLDEAELKVADLRNANLYGADLNVANLSAADLTDATLRNAGLSHANLSHANLSNADLTDAELGHANLSNANLTDANLTDANLSNADLYGANLSNANLNGADLSSVDLSSVDLSGVGLRAIRISNRTRFDRKWQIVWNILNNANFDRNLRNADLIDVDLRGVDLSDANLMAAQVLGTNFEGANLTGACIADWQLGSNTNLKDVKCDYIFRAIDSDGKFTGRLPVDPDSTFAPGEFTQRFQIIASALETIDITFTEGIDWQAFFQSFQDLKQQYPAQNIAVQGMEEKGEAFIVRLKVETEEAGPELERLKGNIETEVKQRYADQLCALEAQYEERLRLQGSRLEDAQNTIEAERQSNTELIRVIGTMAQNQGSKYDMRGSNFGQFVETAESGSRVQSIQHNYASERQSLSGAAKEIRDLLDTLAQSYNTTTKAGQELLMKHFDQEVEKHPKWRRALKEGGIELIKVLCAPIGIPLEMARVYLEEDE